MPEPPLLPSLPPPPATSSEAPIGTTLVDLARAWRARWTPRATAAAGALALVVFGAIAFAAWRGRGDHTPVELTLPRAGTGEDESGAAHPSGGARTPTDEFTVVHVAGAVVSPGLYRLAAGARVADAIDAAGGAAPDADLDAVNLAATLTDGERLYVPRAGEAGPADPLGAAVRPAGGVPLDLNTATAEQLDGLPGIGPATATAIVEFRRERGRFTSVDELLEVRGIGQAKLAAIRSKVRVR